jgi:hypothetical protein
MRTIATKDGTQTTPSVFPVNQPVTKEEPCHVQDQE